MFADAEASRQSAQSTLDRLLEYQVSVQHVLQDLSDEHRDKAAECDTLRQDIFSLREQLSHYKNDTVVADLKKELTEEVCGPRQL